MMIINQLNKETINTNYAQKFPLSNLIIKDNIPYIIIDRDEVYEISNLIDEVNNSRKE